MICKSIRLDFPAAGVMLSDQELLALMQDCFLAAATSGTTRARQQAAVKLSKATSEARVESYDDLREKNGGRPACGPVFYIP